MVNGMMEEMNITVPVALHLDHGSYDGCYKCLEAGFSSIMFDGSHYPIDENVEDVYKRQVLDEIPGVGPARRKALMKSFPSIYEIRDATAEQIAMQADLPMSVAEEIYEFFHNHQEEDCRE